MECPVCKGIIVEGDAVYECENHIYNWKTKEASGCDFIVFKQLLNKKISRPTFEKLLSGAKIQVMGFKNKAGTEFDAKIYLGKSETDEWKILLEFDDSKRKEKLAKLDEI
jgi:DNA topoisomerase-3